MESTNQTCRNCGGSEFYSQDVSLVGEVAQLLPVGYISSRNIHLRVCGKCGLMELFVAADTLEKVKKKFSKDS